jgi:hypothetical protein
VNKKLKAKDLVDLLTVFPASWLRNSQNLLSHIQEGNITLIQQSSPAQALLLHDDFLVDQFIGNGNWTATGAGTGAAAQAVTTGSFLAGAMGVVGFTTGTTATGSVLFRQGVGALPMGSGGSDLLMRARAGSATIGSTEEVNLKLGFGSQATAVDPAYGAYFELDPTVSPNWKCVVRHNSVLIGSVAGPVAVAAWNNYRVQISPKGDNFYFLIDDVVVAHIPCGATIAEDTSRFGPMMQIVKRTGTAQRFAYLDLVELSKDTTR